MKDATWDLTTLPIGDYPFGNFYAVPLSECPVCHRIGQKADFDDGMWMHIISLYTDDNGKTYHGPVWVSEYCNTDHNRQVISEPAATMRGKPLQEKVGEIPF